ncbi:MAG: VWA domain-containing protein [Noviherbaspirillum sp.]
MIFLWPKLLLLLLLVPVMVAVYLLLRRRRVDAAQRYANLAAGGTDRAMAHKRMHHLPPLLFLSALVLLLLAVARPALVITLPSQHDTVILAIDVSGSMQAKDVEPTRLAAAKVAAKTFVAGQPRTTRVGVVSFAASASVVQSPTENQDDIVAALDRLHLQGGTALGSGILASLKTIFPDTEFNVDYSALYGGAGQAAMTKRPEVKPVPPGSFASAAIILLTDGQTTTGPDPIVASRIAAERGIRVFTVGIGTPDGEVIGTEGWSMRVRLDEETLKEIATITNAEYFYADSGENLTNIYKKLKSRLIFEKKETEVSALFSAAAALLSLLGALFSLAWYQRIL